MTVAVLVLWLAGAVYLFGRSLAYLYALVRVPGWHWLTDVRLALLLAPFLLPVALSFYSADPSAIVLGLMVFAMVLASCAFYVFKTILSELRDDLRPVARASHWVGGALVCLVIAVVLAALR